MGQALNYVLLKTLKDKADLKEARKIVPFTVLLCVSVYVFMDMENHISVFRNRMRSSISERELEQQQSYNQIVSQLKDYDGKGTALEKLIEETPEYKYKFVEPDDDD